MLTQTHRKEAVLEDFVERGNNNVDGDFLHLATALDPQWKDLKESSREGCLRKMRAALDLLKGEEGVARDKVDAPKPKRRPMCAWHHTGREGVLLDGAAPEQEEAEHFKGDCAHAIFLERKFGFVITEHER